MPVGTKILLQPPYQGGFALSYAEATSRLLFFLSYFEDVTSLIFNPHLVQGSVLASPLVEQEYCLNHGGKCIGLGRVQVDDIGAPDLYRGMAREILAQLNSGGGGYALAPTPHGPPDVGGQDHLVLTMSKCVPVPHPKTSLATLLDFRASHAAELALLHDAMEDLYYGLGSRPVDQLLPKFQTRLDEHVRQVLAAHERRQIRSYLATLSVGLKVAPAVVGELIGLAAGVPLLGTAIGGVIGLGIDKTLLPLTSNTVPKDFKYILSGLAAGHLAAFPTEEGFGIDIRLDGVRHSIVSNAQYPISPANPVMGQHMLNYVGNIS